MGDYTATIYVEAGVKRGVSTEPEKYERIITINAEDDIIALKRAMNYAALKSINSISDPNTGFSRVTVSELKKSSTTINLDLIPMQGLLAKCVSKDENGAVSVKANLGDKIIFQTVRELNKKRKKDSLS